MRGPIVEIILEIPARRGLRGGRERNGRDRTTVRKRADEKHIVVVFQRRLYPIKNFSDRFRLLHGLFQKVPAMQAVIRDGRSGDHFHDRIGSASRLTKWRDG